MAQSGTSRRRRLGLALGRLEGSAGRQPHSPVVVATSQIGAVAECGQGSAEPITE